MSTADSVLDVREIDETPFGPITDALEDLAEEETLVLVNSFEPKPLYGILEQRGFAYETEEAAPDEWRIRIEHA